jgi:putative FmdB family regulatory protein
MPIYEFYCGDCHRVYSFLSRSVDVQKRPACPRCGRSELTRRVSSFAISKGRREEPASAPGDESGGMPGMDDERLARAMESLAGEAEGLNDEDPRQAAQLMRKLFDAAGMPVSAGMDEALRRMGAGEDPEKVEEELGDALEQDPFGAPPAPGRPAGFSSLRRRMLPPSVDPTLYEM